MEGVNEREPAVGLARFEAGFQTPVAGTIGFLDLPLGKVKRPQVGARQCVKAKREAGVFFDLLFADDQAGAGTANEQWHLRMDAKNFEDWFRVGKEFRRHEDKSERNLLSAQLMAQRFRPLLEARFVEAVRPMGR